MVIAFTGHRKLNKEVARKKLEDYLYNTLFMQVVNKKVDNIQFIMGGALGFDQIAFDVVSEAQETFAIGNTDSFNISTEIAIPFKRQSSRWSEEQQTKYNSQLLKANKITYVDTLERYRDRNAPVGMGSYLKLQLRNCYMVDKLREENDLLIAWFSGSKGGTKNCIDYAKKQGKKILNLFEK